jgi:hypothetical protein
MDTFIRIEDDHGVGVFRNDKNYNQFDYTHFIYMIGILTRAPFGSYISELMRKTHPRESKIEHGFQKYIRNDNSKKEYCFAWNKDFFKRIAKGELTDNEKSFWEKWCSKTGDRPEFETPSQYFLELLIDNGFGVYEVIAKPVHYTEQQCVFEKGKDKKKLIVDWKEFIG